MPLPLTPDIDYSLIQPIDVPEPGDDVINGDLLDILRTLKADITVDNARKQELLKQLQHQP